MGGAKAIPISCSLRRRWVSRRAQPILLAVSVARMSGAISGANSTRMSWSLSSGAHSAFALRATADWSRDPLAHAGNLSHAPGHEAANVDRHMVGPATIDRPHHRAACSIRLGDNRFVRHVPPLIFDP